MVTKSELNWVNLVMRYRSNVIRLEEINKALRDYIDEMDDYEVMALHFERDNLEVNITHQEYTIKQNEINWRSTAFIKLCWRVYGTWDRLYWKQNNRRWRWDSDVIARTNGSKFLTREAIVDMCAHTYLIEQSKMRDEG